jgi:hypothetical protein
LPAAPAAALPLLSSTGPNASLLLASALTCTIFLPPPIGLAPLPSEGEMLRLGGVLLSKLLAPLALRCGASEESAK